MGARSARSTLADRRTLASCRLTLAMRTSLVNQMRTAQCLSGRSGRFAPPLVESASRCDYARSRERGPLEAGPAPCGWPRPSGAHFPDPYVIKIASGALGPVGAAVLRDVVMELEHASAPFSNRGPHQMESHVQNVHWRRLKVATHRVASVSAQMGNGPSGQSGRLAHLPARVDSHGRSGKLQERLPNAEYQYLVTRSA